jgi:predicted Zn-ribbon and HTH transcriptional regulator
MECPHCKYKHGYDYHEDKNFDGSEGDFYELPVKMERDGYDFRREEVRVYGCPKCKITFIGERW